MTKKKGLKKGNRLTSAKTLRTGGGSTGIPTQG